MRIPMDIARVRVKTKRGMEEIITTESQRKELRKKYGNARKFADEMVSSGTVVAIRAEDGNLRYEYFQTLDDPERILLIDSWRDQAAIDVHHASPMMETIAALREKYDLHMKVERYTSDEGGIPSTDDAFIRK